MKLRMLPVKRRPVQQGVLRRLSAVTRQRKQRVAASAAAAGYGDIDAEDGSSKISRALTIIFLIHIVAIGLIFVHQKFLREHAPAEGVGTAAAAAATPTAAPAERESLPQIATNEEFYVVQPGDNYARIAAARNVDEAELRALNRNAEIEPKLLLRLPAALTDNPEPPADPVLVRGQGGAPAAARETPAAIPAADHGLVDAIDVANAPRARPIQSAAATAATTPSSGTSHTVKPGDTLWKIANQHGLDVDTLMRANRITDARRLQVGMNLVIPRP